MFEFQSQLLCKPASLHQWYNPAEVACFLCFSLLLYKTRMWIVPGKGYMDRGLGGARVGPCDVLGVWADSLLHLWDPCYPLLSRWYHHIYLCNPFAIKRFWGPGPESYCSPSPLQYWAMFKHLTPRENSVLEVQMKDVYWVKTCRHIIKGVLEGKS